MAVNPDAAEPTVAQPQEKSRQLAKQEKALTKPRALVRGEQEVEVRSAEHETKLRWDGFVDKQDA